ncbi:hypothetical protein [Mucilaginibacter pocheonensis]|uniref:Lipoprotein n=1 Tax=Mucilaginibacter pocheonensis TaxID=398050 RepID=A0ABU1TCG2_9SPHI|nr:hypothetical protein [Mucilaginibacter pocheonensis]MDR6943086.1 hypothetical protein [Mucilaginibacter pocheonensis]
MKKISYLLTLFVLAACHSNKKPELGADTLKQDITAKTVAPKKADQDSLIKPYKLIADYMVTDTGYVDATVMGATYAVITKNGKLVDTIEKGYGVQKVNDHSYLYRTIMDTGPLEDPTSGKAGYKNNISGSLGNYILTLNGKKQNLSKLIPDFNDYFSSPSVINGKIYYWQIKKIDTTGNNSISAAQYDPVTKETMNHYLVNDYIETDNADHFAAPYIKNDTIYFDGENNKLKKFTKDLKLYN